MPANVERGLRNAVCLAEAGAPRDLTGYDDEKSRRQYADVIAAAAWLRGLLPEKVRK
jgi:hypothetical protein